MAQMKKKFKFIIPINASFSPSRLIGLAKGMIKTNAKIIGVDEEKFCIIFSIQENFPIFKRQLESYGIIVEEIK